MKVTFNSKIHFIIIIFGFGIFLIKHWSNGKFCDNDNSLIGKVAIVTGATSGVGFETAKELIRRGATVYVTCRSTSKCDLLLTELNVSSTGSARPLILELASLKSIHECAGNFTKLESRLDILINNAGLFYTDGKTEDGFDLSFGVNHLGHFLLTNFLMKHLLQSRDARVITVSSITHDVSRIDWEFVRSQDGDLSAAERYFLSKLANVLFAQELARRCSDTNVTSYSLHPGVVFSFNTRILRSFVYGGELVERLIAALLWPFTKSEVAGAQTSLHLATEERHKLRSGGYYEECAERGLRSPPDVASLENAQRLWQASLDLLSLPQHLVHPLFT